MDVAQVLLNSLYGGSLKHLVGSQMVLESFHFPLQIQSSPWSTLLSGPGIGALQTPSRGSPLPSSSVWPLFPQFPPCKIGSDWLSPWISCHRSSLKALFWAQLSFFGFQKPLPLFFWPSGSTAPAHSTMPPGFCIRCSHVYRQSFC